MDKQKQIEEMAKYICGYVQSKELDSLKLISWKSGNPLFLGVSHNYGVAEYLHDAGYRKIPENEEKLEKQVRELDKELNLAKSVLSYDDERPLKKWAEHLRKETAEKFAEKVKDKLNEWLEDNESLDGKIDFGLVMIELIGVKSLDGEVIAESLIDEICKEIKKDLLKEKYGVDLGE